MTARRVKVLWASEYAAVLEMEDIDLAPTVFGVFANFYSGEAIDFQCLVVR